MLNLSAIELETGYPSITILVRREMVASKISTFRGQLQESGGCDPPKKFLFDVPNWSSMDIDGTR